MTVQLFTPAVEVAVAITMTPSAVEHVRKQLDKKLERAWGTVCRNRGWDDQPEACTEQRRGFRIDYSVLSADSVFSGLKDENLFKIGYTKLLTAMKWMAKIAATGKKVLEEGLV